MTSRHAWRIFSVMIAIFVCLPGANGDEPSVVRSEPVSLGNGDFYLTAKNDHSLTLEHVRNGKTKTWDVAPVVMEITPPEFLPGDGSRTDTWPKDDDDAKITSIALSRWSRTSLLAVVKVSRKDSATFWWLALGAPERWNESREITSRAAVISKTDLDHTILAVSGTRNPPAITVVIGKYSSTRPGAIDTGIMAFEWCGYVESTRVGRFRTEYLPHPFDSE